MSTLHINLTAFFELGIVTGVLISPLIYYWAKRKTTDPVITSIFGVGMMFFPFINLIYLLLLFNKPDLVLKVE